MLLFASSNCRRLRDGHGTVSPRLLVRDAKQSLVFEPRQNLHGPRCPLASHGQDFRISGSLKYRHMATRFGLRQEDNSNSYLIHIEDTEAEIAGSHPIENGV